MANDNLLRSKAHRQRLKWNHTSAPYVAARFRLFAQKSALRKTFSAIDPRGGQGTCHLLPTCVKTSLAFYAAWHASI